MCYRDAKTGSIMVARLDHIQQIESCNHYRSSFSVSVAHIVDPFQSGCKTRSHTANRAGPRSAVGNVSGYRCVSDCRSRGREFDPGPVPYFRGD